MATITLIVQAPATIELHNDREGVEELNNILGQFQPSDDYLTNRLHQWGTEVAQAFREHQNDSEEEISRIAQDRIEILAHEIPLNPTILAPLQDLAAGEAFLSASLLNGDPMNTATATHTFAQKMMDWMRKFAPSQNTETVSSTIMQFQEMSLVRNDPQWSIARVIISQAHEQDIILAEQMRGFRERMQEILRSTDQCVDLVRKETLSSLQKAKENEAIHDEEIQQTRESIDQDLLDRIQIFNDQIALESRISQANIDVLKQRMASMDQANTATKETLRKEIENEKLKQQSSVAGLQRQMDTMKQEATQASARLQDKLASNSQTHKAALSNQTQDHERTSSLLKTQISENEQTLTQTKQLAEAEKAKCVKNKAEIERLQALVNQAQVKIEGLKRKIQGKGCWDFLK